MVQVKLFNMKTPFMNEIEKQVNDFLKENDGKISVKDIKYMSFTPNTNNSTWQIWTVMVIYE